MVLEIQSERGSAAEFSDNLNMTYCTNITLPKSHCSMDG